MPARWRPAGPGGSADGPIQGTTWADDAGARIAPIAVRGPLDRPTEVRWSGKALQRLFAECRPDVVQVEAEPWTPLAASTVRSAHRLKIPVVLLTRQSVPRALGFRERLRQRRVLRRVDTVIAANGIAARLIARHHPTLRVTVVSPLAVAAPTTAAREPGPALAIGFLGRLVPERGLDLLFRACVPLPGRWTVTVIGTGPSQEELEALAERLGIAARVTWLGALHRQAIDEIWPTLDCVALPSRSTEHWVEAFGRAAVEAMAHGLPVVATSSGILPEIVGDAGRIVPEDDVPALTAALQDLLTDPALLAQLSMRSRRRAVEEFSPTAIAARTLDVWRGAAAAAAAMSPAAAPAGSTPPGEQYANG